MLRARPATLIKNEALAHVFSCELWKNFKKTFFIEPVAAFALNIFGTVHTKMESQGKMVLHFYTEILRVLQLMVRNSVFVVDFLIPESYSWLKLPTNKFSTKNLIWKRI